MGIRLKGITLNHLIVTQGSMGNANGSGDSCQCDRRGPKTSGAKDLRGGGGACGGQARNAITETISLE